ncbi:hypothetical protein RF11_08093 [Thelohanellus kitauei]|uniref:Uncharacterized protein n=1 Tax=Thelohanellus kitauei TaxID=669202 RepID=A0A0C2IIT5_THEKT|nr:hypothetical protein RF11_08093 [Thelohanellus kitauei]
MYQTLRVEREELECYFRRTRNFKFEPPDIVELRENFQGMNNFIFSDAYSNLVMYIIVDWHQYSISGDRRAFDCLLVACMSMCLILKAALNQNVTSRLHKTIDLIFGIRDDLGDTNAIVFLVYLSRKVNQTLLSSVIDYLCELSMIPKEVFEDLSEIESNMNEKALYCRDLALVNLLNRPQDVVEDREERTMD